MVVEGFFVNNKLAHVILILLIAVVSVLVYSQTLKFSYLADDRRLIYENTDFLEDWGNLKSTFVSPLPVKTYEPLPFYRPIVSLTYFVGYHRGNTLAGHHLFNLGVHIANTILLYLLMFLLFKNLPLSIFTSLFFAAHPIHVSSVAWISARTDLIACFFFLLTLILFLKARDYKGSPRQLLLAGSVISYVLCLFSKETTLALPLFLFVWDCISRREPIKKKIIPYIPFVVITLLYLIWRVKVIGDLGTGEPYTSAGLFHRFLTVFPIYFYHFKKLVLPLQFNLSPRVATVTSMLSLKFLGSLIIFAVVLGLGISLRKRSKEICFGILWILITLVPVLNLVALYAPVKEWWVYIPSIGFCLILGKLAAQGIGWEKKVLEIKRSESRQDEQMTEVEEPTEDKRIMGIRKPSFSDGIVIRANHLLSLFFALLLIFYALNIKSQSKIFAKEIFFWRAAAERAPHDAVVHTAYGLELNRRGINRLAQRQFRKAIEADPRLAEPHNHLGMLYQMRAQNDSALTEIQEAVRLDSNYADAYANLGFVYAQKEQFALSISALEKALRLNPQHFEAQRNLGMVYSYGGRFEEAIEYLEKAKKFTKNPRYIQEIEGIIQHFKSRQE